LLFPHHLTEFWENQPVGMRPLFIVPPVAMRICGFLLLAFMVYFAVGKWV
jgi:hypothetical protein